jgi:hypothetical protein
MKGEEIDAKKLLNDLSASDSEFTKNAKDYFV